MRRCQMTVKRFFSIVIFIAMTMMITASSFAECVEGSCDNGKGTYLWANGDTYIGEWENDLMDGEGTYLWENGDEFTGGWQEDIMHGDGVYTWSNGDQNIGQWINGEQDGDGIYIWGNLEEQQDEALVDLDDMDIFVASNLEEH